jgi:hypothetical protein
MFSSKVRHVGLDVHKKQPGTATSELRELTARRAALWGQRAAMRGHIHRVVQMAVKAAKRRQHVAVGAAGECRRSPRCQAMSAESREAATASLRFNRRGDSESGRGRTGEREASCRLVRQPANLRSGQASWPGARRG